MRMLAVGGVDRFLGREAAEMGGERTT